MRLVSNLEPERWRSYARVKEVVRSTATSFSAILVPRDAFRSKVGCRRSAVVGSPCSPLAPTVGWLLTDAFLASGAQVFIGVTLDSLAVSYTCVESPEAETEVALPADGGDDALASWRAGHAQADVTIALEEGMLPDDAAALLIKDLLAHIAKNPAMSKGWKAEADKKLAEQDGL